MVSGIRPIRIDIPKTGQRFVFTKVLNVRAEPLAVRALAMEQAAFNALRGSMQAAVFVIGLVLTAWQWRRKRANSLVLTLGLALMIGAVGSLLMAWRLLHMAFIVEVPVIGLAVAVWGIRKLWKRGAKKDEGGGMRDDGGTGGLSVEGGERTTGGPSVPPVVAGIIALLLVTGSAQAKQDRVEDNSVSILSASYTGTVRALDTRESARAGQFEAVLTINSADDGETVRLFGEEVAVQDFSASPNTVKLVREGKAVSVFLPRKGAAVVKMKFLVKTSGDVARRQVLFGIPAALVSRVSVTLDEPDAQVEAPTAVSLKTATSGQQTTVDTVLGAATRVELNWTPRMKRAADVTTTVFCNNAALVTFAGGAVSVRSLLDYQVTQGELRQMRVALPAGQRLMRVEGDSIRTWKLDGQILSVELVKGVTPSYRLTVETQVVGENAGGGPTSTVMAVQIPHALDVKRETGLVALKAADELSVSLAGQTDLQKVDADEFMKLATGATNLSGAYRFLKPEFTLSVRVEPVQPQIEALVRNHVRVTTEQIGIQAVVDYTIKRAGVFTLRLALPDGYRVENVNGAQIAQWVEKTEKPRVLEVTLKERASGAYKLTMDLVRSLKELPKSLELTGVQPLDVQKLNGFVSVSAEEGVQIKTEAFDGISEVPATLLSGTPQGGAVLGFKLIPSESGVQAAWKLTVSTEKIESWVRAEVMNTVTLSETLVSGRSIVRYDIANAPTKDFRVRVPATFRNVEVIGANIRRKDHDEQTGEWRVELQNKVRGCYQLTVTWDRPWDAKSGALEVVGVEAPGVERETGSVAIIAPSKLRVEPKSLTADLLKVDVRDLPEWATRTGGDTPVLAYKYLRPGFKLSLATQRFDEAEVLQALVDNVRLTTVVSEDGQMMTEMSLAIRNNARQYLEIALPPGTTNVWSAFVNGQPVRPSIRNGKLLLPMDRSQGDSTVPVEVTYVGSSPFPRHRGAVALTSPALDVPLQNARWELYLPPDYAYANFDGTMKRELRLMPEGPVNGVATLDVSTPVVRSYGLSEYNAEESRKVMVDQQEVQSLISNAKVQLAGGNVKEANSYFNRLQRGKGVVADREYEGLEKGIKKAQAGNLIQGQQAFVAQNSSWGAGVWQLGVGANQPPANQPVAQRGYDEAAAEQQAAKVQAAQEVTVSKAVPLRLNLPKRGVYFVFSQVLQTELSKPMSVQFSAASERGAGWPAWVTGGLVSLVVLWVLVNFTLARRHARS